MLELWIRTVVHFDLWCCLPKESSSRASSLDPVLLGYSNLQEIPSYCHHSSSSAFPAQEPDRSSTLGSCFPSHSPSNLCICCLPKQLHPTVSPSSAIPWRNWDTAANSELSLAPGSHQLCRNSTCRVLGCVSGREVMKAWVLPRDHLRRREHVPRLSNRKRMEVLTCRLLPIHYRPRCPLGDLPGRPRVSWGTWGNVWPAGRGRLPSSSALPW